MQVSEERPAEAAKVAKAKVTPQQQKQCLNGDGEICYRVAVSYQKAAEVIMAFKFFEIGCNLDHADSCFEAGKLKEVYKSPLESELFLRKGCRFKNGDACLRISELIEERKAQAAPVEMSETEQEKEVEEEKKKEVEESASGKVEQREFVEFEDQSGDVLLYLTHACDYKSREGCMRLGFYYDERKELEKAFVFFLRACRLDQVSGCYNAGVIKSKMGQEAFGLEYFILGCDKKNAESCYSLAVFYSKKEQLEKGLFFLERALNYGYKDWEKLEGDGDLSNLRVSPKFQELINSVKSRPQ
ncbi:MAG: sel1 repeat family protein [Bdellovibrio sp.]|nr:sel1 repeat family protein [Bdellovibrio sp.]